MSKRLLLPQDPRWLGLVERFSGDLAGFSMEVRGQTPSFQQMDLFSSVAVSSSRTSVASGHGCFGKGTEIMLSTGRIKLVEDIQVGDKLMGDDGVTERTVQALYRGQERLYRFTYNDHSSHVFNESHILCLVATNTKGRRKTGDKCTVTVREWLQWGEDKKRCHAIYRAPINAFPAAILPIDPYFLGVWLGDGNSTFPSITTMDAEVVNAVYDCATSHGCYVTKVNQSKTGAADIYNIAFKSGSTNPVTQKLKRLGVLSNKHIPDCYLYADREARLQLLAGLIDTDGSKDGKGYDFIQKSERLAKQVCWLVRSIGCHATIKQVKKVCTNNGAVGVYWRVTIGRNTQAIPVRIARKKINNECAQRNNLHFGIKSVEALGEGDYYGFELDGNKQFLGGDFTVLHNTGKTTALATIVWWHLVCHEQSVTLVTANDMDQLKSTLWKEIGKAEWEIKNGPFGWITDYVEIMADNRMRVIGFEDTWFVESKTADEKNANKMAGRHAEWLLIIGDEASTLPNAVLTTLSGALTEEHNRMLLTSQYTENAGFFHETQTTLSESNGGVWTNLRFSSLDSPWVNNESIKMLWDMYDDDERRVRILGLPPANSSAFMMNLKVAEAMYRRGRIIKDSENYGWLVCADIASGEGLRDKSAVVVVRVIGYGDYGPDARRVEVVEIPVHVNNIRSNVFAGHVADAGSNLSNVTYLPDSGGLGVNVCQDLEDMGKVVSRVLWGEPCFKSANAERYLNKRAQAMHHAARAAKEGRLSILTPEYRRVMLDQSSRIPKRFSGNRSKMVVPPKGSPEWKGLKSPDLWDAICFAFLENAEYMPADRSTKGMQAKTQGDKALEDAAALFENMGD